MPNLTNREKAAFALAYWTQRCGALAVKGIACQDSLECMLYWTDIVAGNEPEVNYPCLSAPTIERIDI